MIGFQSKNELEQGLKGIADIANGTLLIGDAAAFRNTLVDTLIYTAVFAKDTATQALARWVIWEASQSLGCPSSSIQELYDARARTIYHGMTVPAINIRGITYDVARTLFKTLKKLSASACIFEIAKSEIGYTNQRPEEYTSCILAAALKENYEGPVFIQGDHVQASAKNYAKDKTTEIAGLEALIREEVAAGFYNIDIDTSTLVDLSQETIYEQQRVNFENCAHLTKLIRDIEPDGITISVGGEIAEVGGKNSTIEEFTAYMDGYLATLSTLAPKATGISKISIQTGTSHGGVPLADGTVAEVKLDFACLETISNAARERYKLGGAVQHGASTLPDEAFNRFPETETVEVHLATGFQNLIYDHPAFPAELREAIYTHLRATMADEKKSGETDAQFIYKTRKKGFGPFKQQMWAMPGDTKAAILKDLGAMFERIFHKLAIEGSSALVSRIITPVSVHRPIAR